MDDNTSKPGSGGSSGSGKLTLINTIRGLKLEDRGAAAVDVKEAAMEPTPYVNPTNVNIKLWDLPGVGTPNYQKEKYLELVTYNRYDGFFYSFIRKVHRK